MGSDASKSIESRIMRTFYRMKHCIENPFGVRSKGNIFCFQEPETHELSHINHFQICHTPQVESLSQSPNLSGPVLETKLEPEGVHCGLSSGSWSLLQSGFANLGKDCPTFPLHWPVPSERFLASFRVQEANHVVILQVHSNLRLFFLIR